MSILIRKLDGTEASHAALYLGDGMVGESLIVGNRGLHANPLTESIAGCDWIEARRLADEADLTFVLASAQQRLAMGGNYGFDQVFLVAAICATRKIDLGDGLLRKIVHVVFQKANEFTRLMTSQGREPMICSEFVYRAYDEAELSASDRFSLEILSQSERAARSKWSLRHRKRGFFASLPETEIPTVEPGSFVDRLLHNPDALTPIRLGSESHVEVTDAELDGLIHEWNGDAVSMRAGTASRGVAQSGNRAAPDISKSQVEAAAMEFIQNVAEAPLVFEADRLLCGTVPPAASVAQKAMQVIADFVTPGDLLVSPSLTTVGRIVP